MIRVLLVNEFNLMANVIAAVLEDETDMAVVGGVTSADEALELAPQCDVVLVSSRLPDDGAIKIISELGENLDEINVLILGVAETEWEIMRYVEAGAVGYVLTDDSVEELLRNIRAAYHGESLISPDIAHALMQRVADLSSVIQTAEAIPDVAELTTREEEVLKLIGQDLSNQEIADRLVIEIGTVKNHVHSILKKLNVSSRRDAKAYLMIMDSGGGESA